MTFAGHIGGSLAITVIVQQFAFGHKVTPKVLGLGVLIGLIPDLDALLADYATVHQQVVSVWENNGQHAFFHHISAVFGYEPLIIHHRIQF